MKETKETKERASAPVEEPKRKGTDSAEEERIRGRVASMPDPLEAYENAGEGEIPDPRELLAGGPAGRRVPWPRQWHLDHVETPKALEGLELAAAYLVDVLLLRAGAVDAETREALDFFGDEYQAAKARIDTLEERAGAGKASAGFVPETPEEEALWESWKKSRARGKIRRGNLSGAAPLVPWPVDPEEPETPKALAGLEAVAARVMNALFADGHFPAPRYVLEALDDFGRELYGAKVRVHSLEGLRDGMGAAMVNFSEVKSMLPDVVEHLRETDQVDVLPHAENSLEELSAGMEALAAAGKAGNPLERLAAAISGLESAEMRDAFKALFLEFAEGRRGPSAGAGSEGE